MNKLHVVTNYVHMPSGQVMFYNDELAARRETAKGGSTPTCTVNISP